MTRTKRPSFVDYVKKARTEKVSLVPEVKPKLETEPSTLEAELSSLSTYSSSMNVVKPTQKFNKRVKNRLNFEASLKPATNAKAAPDKKDGGSKPDDLLKKELDKKAKKDAGRPRTPMIISASPSMQNLASSASVLGVDADLEPSSSQVFPFTNDADGGKQKLKPHIPRPKYPSIPVKFVDDGKLLADANGSHELTKEQRAKLAATMIEKVPTEPESKDKVENGVEGEAKTSGGGEDKEDKESTATAAASVAGEEARSEKGSSVVASVAGSVAEAWREA